MKTFKAAVLTTGLIAAMALPAAAQAGNRDNYHQDFRRQVISGHSHYTHPRHQKHYGKHHYKQHHYDRHHHRDYVYYERHPAYYERHVHSRYCDHRRPAFDTRVKVYFGF